MARKLQRRTVYAATIIAILMLAGTWTFASVVITQNPPAQNSSITVINPNGVNFAAVQSTEMVMVTSTISGSAPGGVPAGSGGALNSTYSNVLLPYCPSHQTCPPYDNNFSAVGTPIALTVGDEAVQVSLQVNQSLSPAVPAHGFDVQVELLLSPNHYVFGDGYFDTGASATPTSFWVILFVDTGISSLTPVALENVVVTINQCTVATVCP